MVLPAEDGVGGGPADEAAELIRALAGAGLTVATAESLTGGLVGAALTDVPGASRVYRGGLVVYATDLKATLAGLDPDRLAREGAVSEWTAGQLARGAARRCGAGGGLSTTGVAGPDPQEGRPVGTVFLAVSGPAGQRDGSGGRSTKVIRRQFAGDRAAVRAESVRVLLQLAISTFG